MPLQHLQKLTVVVVVIIEMAVFRSPTLYITQFCLDFSEALPDVGLGLRKNYLVVLFQ